MYSIISTLVKKCYYHFKSKESDYMEITLLIKSAMGLVSLLAVLIFFLFLSPKARAKRAKKKQPKKQAIKKVRTKVPDLESLVATIKDKTIESQKLKETLDLVLKYYGTIPNKLGSRTHPDFDIYMNILFRICRHPATNKDIIINFEKELIKLNPAYKPNINDATTKGINSRGV